MLNGRVYLNCRTDHNVNDKKEKINAGEQVVCWDAATGELLWRDVFNVYQTDIAAPRVGWASMCGDPETGYVYVHSVSGILRCYTGDGKKVWEISRFEELGKISVRRDAYVAERASAIGAVSPQKMIVKC